MPSLNYEDVQALKKAVGLVPKNPVQEQEQKQKEKESPKDKGNIHLVLAKEFKAQAEAQKALAETAKSDGDVYGERHHRWAAKTALEKEERELDIGIGRPKSSGRYEEPGYGGTTWHGDFSPRESPWERSARWEEERYNAEMEASIRRMKEHDHWDYKNNCALYHAVWVGTPEDGHAESTLPRKIPKPEEVYDRLVAAELKIAEIELGLEAKRKNPTSRKPKAEL